MTRIRVLLADDHETVREGLRLLLQAQQDLEYFYDYWVKMYLRRSNRIKPAAPSDPTVLVAWKSLQPSAALSRAG